jgi:hypothetical protein
LRDVGVIIAKFPPLARPSMLIVHCNRALSGQVASQTAP